MVMVEGPKCPCFLLCLMVIWLVTCPFCRACPRPCTCYLSTEVHCTFRYLTSIPDGFPSHVERVNLGYNNLVRLAEADFSGLSRLEMLLLHSNGIHTIPDKTFSDLQALKVLKMSYNKVCRLQKDTFYGLWNLSRLHMDHNSIEFISPETFYGLTELHLVQLEGNRLTQLHADTFVTLRYLQVFKTSSIKYLHLSSNLLSSLPQEMVSSLSVLESLYLHGNPWICDCRLSWLAVWIQEKPDVIKCKKDRNTSNPQQCPLCTNPRTTQGQLLGTVPATAFQCVKPTIEVSSRGMNLNAPQGSPPKSISLGDFMAPLGSLTLNLTDQSGNEATVVCSVGKPMANSSRAAENGSVVLNVTFDVPLVCDLAESHFRAMWQILALYSDTPLMLDRSFRLPGPLALGYHYRQMVTGPEDTFTGVQAALRAQPIWLMQACVALWLDRAATTPRAIVLRFSSQASFTAPHPEPQAAPWTLIHKEKDTKLELTILAGGTVTLDCSGLGDPKPRLQWLLVDGTRVSSPYVSEDSRVLIHRDGRLELHSASTSDSGAYSCVSANSHNADVLTYWVTVVDPHGDADPESVTTQMVFLGESLDLPCQSSGSPDPSTSWVLPGGTVLPGSASHGHVLNNSTLSTPQVTLKDQGLYHCIVANPLGMDVLTYRIAVRIKGPGLGEYHVENEGSGFGEPNPSLVPHPTPAPRGAEAGRPVTRRRLRYHEQRRQHLSSARRIDPQHWAVLLEKAKMRGKPQEQGGLAESPPAHANQITTPREEESSGLTTPGEEAGVLAIAASSAGFPRLLDHPPPKTPTVSGSTPQWGKLIEFQISAPIIAQNAPPATPSSWPSTLSPEFFPLRPLQPEGTVSLRTGHVLKIDHLRGESSVMTGTKFQAGRVRGLPSGSHQISVAGFAESRSSLAHSHPTPELSRSVLPSGQAMAAQSPVPCPRKGIGSPPACRPFTRRRRIWGKGPLTSSYRTPALGLHRFGLVRPQFSGAVEGSTPSLTVPELNGGCLSCPGVESSLPSSAPVHSLKLHPSRIPSTPNPLLPWKDQTDIQTTDTPPMEYLGALWTQVITQTPTSTAVDKIPASPVDLLSVPGTALVRREAFVTPPLVRLLTKYPKPTALAMRKFTRGKISRSQGMAKSPIPREGFRTQRKPEPVLPKTFPTGSPHHTTPLSLFTHLPSIALGHDKAQTRRQGHRPAGTMLPPLTLDPATLSHIPSPEPSTDPLPMQTALLTMTTATPRTSTIDATHIDRPGDRASEREKELDLSFVQSFSFTMETRGVPPGLTPARASAASSTPVFTQTSWGSAEGKASPTELPSRIQTLGVLGQLTENAQNLQETSTSITVLSSWAHQRALVRNSLLRPVLSPGGPFVPTVPSFLSLTHPSAPPVSRTKTHPKKKVPKSSIPRVDPQQLAVEATSPRANSGFTSLTLLTPQVLHSQTSFSPAQPLPVQPWDSPWASPPRSKKNHFGHSLDRAATEVEGPGLPKGAMFPPTWDRQQKAVDGAFGVTTHGSRLPSASLSRNLFERPRIVGGRAASYTVLAHSDIFLPCTATGNPLPTLRWTRVNTGLDLSGRKKDSRFQVLDNGTLSIQKVDIEDRGQYLCSASNAFGSDHLYVTLSVVSYPPRMLEPAAKELTVHSGSSVVLPCPVDGSPRPSISWTLSNQTVVTESLEGNGQAQVTWNGTLVLHNLSVSDGGVYQCTASNAAGQDWLQVRILVIAALPVILEPKREVVAGTWGHSLSLPCTATGTPQPEVRWILPDSTEIQPLQLAPSKLFLFANGTLQVSDVASSEQGTYECIASSPAGSEKRVVLVTLEPQKTLPRIDTASPMWTEVELGARLLLNCSATGEPKPRIAWRLPSKAVIDQWHRMGSRIRVYPNGSLFIDLVADEDEGAYLCMARNPTGETLMPMHVSLRRRAAQIDGERLLSKQVPQGRDLRVDCPASGSPLPDISWHLPDGTVVRPGARSRRARRFTLFANGTLYLGRVGMAAQGDYTCRAQNSLGTDEVRVRLTVLPAVPRIRPGPRGEPRVEEGDTAVLDCEVREEPQPMRLWLLPSGLAINASRDRYILHANGSLAIGAATQLDSGTYVCMARNPGGSDAKTRRLAVVSKAPSPLQGQPSSSSVLRVAALLHSRMLLDCGVQGSPQARVTWHMPGDVALRAPYQGGRVSVHANGTLEIRNVRASDAAEFVCVTGTPGAQRMRVVVRLDVLELPRRPAFRSPAHGKVVARLGQRTVLDCAADGSPTPEISWTLPDGTRLSGTGVQKDGSLIIPKTARSHAGRYRCAARNQAGYVEKLTVLEIGQRPVILTPVAGSVFGLGGETVALHCVSVGNPKPRLSWTVPQGDVLERPGPHGPYVLHDNGSLIIRVAEARDSGQYVCQAHNSEGRAHITVSVVVVAYPPRITHRPSRSVLARIGTVVQLSCRALGVPRPRITWEMPERPRLSGTKRGNALELDSELGTLVLRHPQVQDSGIYKCTARNSLGIDSAATFVRVI